MTAVEMTGTIDKHNHLHLDGVLSFVGPKRVRVIILSSLEDETWDEALWLQTAA